MRKRLLLLTALAALCALAALGWPSRAHDGEHHSPGGNGQPGGAPLAAQGFTPCLNGAAGTFPCSNVDLASLLPIADIDGTDAAGVTSNDVWGWTDHQTGKEYALLGLSNGVAFVDITDPASPVHLGNLPTHSVNSLWRGVKVYRDHAFVISEAANHGLQIFDLRQLRGRTAPAVTFGETAHYDNVSSTHTIAVNEETGFVYLAGSRPNPNKTVGVETCGGRGLHMVDVRNPSSPAFAGCVDSDGYTHETQCVIYRGPDAAHRDREICFSANEDTVTIVDVTNKANPVQLSRTTYAGRGYTHQGWLTDDHKNFLLNDELDETGQHVNTRTFVWDVTDLDAPFVKNVQTLSTTAIDHNLYVRGRFVFESNYRSGVRVLDTANVAASGALSEVAFFDVYPADDQPLFNGTWANYPFFASGTVIASGMEQGLFVLKPRVGLPVHIDYTPFFVRQHYRDFLSREPDEGGLAFWSHEIAACTTDAQCAEVKRINVSAAFFLSIEFQQTGYLVYRFYKSAFGDMPGAPVPVRREEFLPDTRRIGEGVRVGIGDWAAQLEANKQAFALEFVSRQRFADAFPAAMTPAEFVNKLNANTGFALTQAEVDALVAELSADNTNAGRASVLRKVAENAELARREFNKAFVLMQYFGYLQRNPNDAPDTGFGGFNFWLGKLDEFQGNFIQAEMVKAFITSIEYRQRFNQ
ncbi:MAG TPA: choice-of-anchor B family protein [Pyrinomonadaceae bacterium]|nr:choice-of-anchor B family protein [Pyrinomonadaceae bacterium]